MINGIKGFTEDNSHTQCMYTWIIELVKIIIPYKVQIAQ